MKLTPPPLARTAELTVQQANEESLVYDKRNYHAHCLGPVASVVWRHCDGRRSVDELARIVHRHLGAPEDKGLVELTLQELGQAGLLEQYATLPAEQAQHTRREISRRLGAGAASFLLAPLITSIMTQSAFAQASPAPAAPAGTTAGPTTPAPTTPPPAPSDRNIKENFADVDVHHVLHHLARMPIQHWNYRADDASVRHIGPMAQDFASAFRVGTDDKTIHLLDASGVAFAAIQALYQILQDRDEQLASLRLELEDLRAELQSCA